MAQNYSIIQIVGMYGPSYEGLFAQVNPTGAERVSAMDAAQFMKRSGLSDLLLAKIWECADWENCGSLDKHGWFVAMKLIALAQAGKDVSIGNLQLDVPPPRVGNPPDAGGPRPLPPGNAPVMTYPTLGNEERLRYESRFDAQHPITMIPGGKLVLGGDKFRTVLPPSILPTDKLARIWELSDVDKDGALDRDEFVIAMHLVQCTCQGIQLPRELPPNIIPPRPVVSQGDAQVIPEADRMKFEAMFRSIDTDLDGLVSGAECRDLFVRSGLQQQVLAQIWKQHDPSDTGRLNLERFVMAMCRIQSLMRGESSLPGAVPQAPASIGNLQIDPRLLEFPEIQKLKIEFEKLAQERADVDRQRQQEENTIRLQQNELSMLQREFESVSSTVRQLELQKGEAQKRLDELAERTRRLRASATEMRDRADAERRECESLRNAVGAQSTSRREREEEVNALRTQLSAVTQEEHSLNDRLSIAQSECDRLARAIRETVANTDRVRQTITKYEEQKSQLTKLIAQFHSGQQPGTYLASQALESIPDPPELPSFNFSAPKAAPTADNAFGSASATIGGGFSNVNFNANFESGFGNSTFGAQTADPFGNASQADPFGGDPFSFGAFDSNKSTADPFASNSADPFATTSVRNTSSPAPPRPAKAPTGAAPPRPFKPAVPASGWANDPFATFGSQSSDKPSGNSAQGGSTFPADFSAFGDPNSPWG